MRGFALATALLALAALGVQPARAAGTSTVPIQTAILSPGSVSKVADINFGSIGQSNTAGTVVMTPGATAACSPSAGLIRTGPCQAANFAIRGRRNQRVRIRENSGGAVTLNGPSGATMTMTNITIATSAMTVTNGANGWNLGNYTINDANGMTNFYLGGTLNLGSASPAGVYRGTVAIDIQFN